MKRLRVIAIFFLIISGFVRAQTYPFMTIDTPGFYKLASNVTNQITISASDVTLDMNGGTVSGGMNGIVINGGLSNVTVKNGTVTLVTSDGIQVGAGCSNITLKDITVMQALIGINCEQVTNGLIQGCDLNSSTTGLELDMCHNIVLEKCTARANTHAGFDLLSSTTCSFIECQALSTGDGNTNISSEVFGFLAKDGNGNLFERCIANATQALSVTGSDSVVAGFALRGSESCTKIIGSEAVNSETNENGFTIPYGILLEGTIDSTQSVTGGLQTAGSVLEVDWSPDGQYVAVGGSGLTAGTGDEFQIFRFDRVSEALTVVTGALGTAGTVEMVTWSPDGQYVAVGGDGLTGGSGDELQIFSFDRAAGILTSVTGALGTTGNVLTIDWSSDGQLLAIGGSGLSTGSGDELQIFSFDRAAGRLSSVTGFFGATGILSAVDWSPDGEYVAVGGSALTTGSGDEFQIFSFNRSAGTLSSVTGALGTSGNDVHTVNWSPDGEYVAIGGDQLTTGAGGELQIFSFNRSAGTLTAVVGALGTAGFVRKVNWSPDGQYVAVGGNGLTAGSGDVFQIFRFDRAAGTLTSITGTLGTAGDLFGAIWSPDGQYVAIGGSGVTGGAGEELQILTGLQFPEKNVIKGNTVYCNSGAQFPSGVGISGSSISNMIIGNTAFNNPIPRAANAPIVSSNYQFVTNVFDQLFGEGPSLTQNVSTSGMTPLPTVPDVSARIKRTELLLESLIDNLL